MYLGRSAGKQWGDGMPKAQQDVHLEVLLLTTWKLQKVAKEHAAVN